MNSLTSLFAERDAEYLPVYDCHICTAFLACLRPDRLDDTGQWHLDAASRLYADLPALYSLWFLADLAEYRLYESRGEREILSAHRGLYEHGWRWPWWVPNPPPSEYVPELDGDPWEDAGGIDRRPEWWDSTA